MILMGANQLFGPSKGVGPNGTRFARCYFMAPKSLETDGFNADPDPVLNPRF